MGGLAPTFSVIIPTYRRPERVAACLEALTRSHYPREQFEVIVVDDGGSPPGNGLEPLCTRWSARLVGQPHSGPAAARNKGASLAAGKFLAFTDDDCLPHPDWLCRLAEQLDSTPDCLVGGRTLNGLPRNLCAAASQELISYLYLHFNAGQGGPRFFTSNNIAMATARFRSTGGFDQFFSFAAAEDRDFCDRWLRAGSAMVYVPEAVIHHVHNLNLADFWFQHFRYGRGSYRFHRKRADRARAGLHLETLPFYFRLITYPLTCHYRPFENWGVSLLMTVSQFANAAGYLRERWTDKA